MSLFNRFSGLGMGKGGESGPSSDGTCTASDDIIAPSTVSPSPSDRLISWDEVRLHTKKGDSWFVIEGNVYDTSRFARHHPGGHVITHWQGQDATEAWRAMHTDFKKVGRYMKPLRIGRVIESTMCKVQKDDVKLVEEFEQMRQKCVNLGYFKPYVPFFIATVGQLLVFEILGYLTLSYFGVSWLSWIVSAVFLASGQAQGGWSQHDFGHLSVFKSVKMNHFVHWFTMCFMKGASTDWWNHMHNQHHSKTNVINKDPDVRLEKIFVLGKVIPKRIASERKSLMPFNWQQSYFFVIGPPLLFPIFFQIMTIRHPIVQKRYMDLAVMVFFYLRFFYMFVPILGLMGFLKFYFFIRILESHWFVWVTQSNHIPMDIDDDKERCWFHAQIHSTCNVDDNPFNNWFTGHLNYQVEHHLFPTMPRCNLHKTTKMVKEMCVKHGIDFQSKTLSTAFIDIIKSLKHSGEIWYSYYYSVAQTGKEY